MRDRVRGREGEGLSQERGNVCVGVVDEKESGPECERERYRGEGKASGGEMTNG